MPVSARPTPLKANGAAPAGVIPVVLMLLAILGLPASGQAQSPLVPQPAPAARAAELQRPSIQSFARINSCEILVDLSSSVDRAPFQATVTDVSRMLTQIVDALHCNIVRTAPIRGKPLHLTR